MRLLRLYFVGITRDKWNDLCDVGAKQMYAGISTQIWLKAKKVDATFWLSSPVDLSPLTVCSMQNLWNNCTAEVKLKLKKQIDPIGSPANLNANRTCWVLFSWLAQSSERSFNSNQWLVLAANNPNSQARPFSPVFKPSSPITVFLCSTTRAWLCNHSHSYWYSNPGHQEPMLLCPRYHHGRFQWDLNPDFQKC